MSDNTSFKKDIYSGVATYGKVRTLIGSIFGTIIAILLIVIGIYLIRAKNAYTIKTTGKITKATNTKKYNNNKYVYDVALVISYVVSNNTLESTLNIPNSNIQYQEQQILNIQVNDANLKDIKLESTSTKIIGIGLIIGAFVIILLSWITYYFVSKHKSVAAITGSVSAFSDITNIFTHH